MKTWVIKIGTSILRGTEETSTEEVIENLSRSFTSFLSKGNKLILVTSGAVGSVSYTHLRAHETS